MSKTLVGSVTLVMIHLMLPFSSQAGLLQQDERQQIESTSCISHPSSYKALDAFLKAADRVRDYTAHNQNIDWLDVGVSIDETDSNSHCKAYPDLKASVKKAVEVGIQRLAELNPSLLCKFSKTIADQNPIVRCYSDADFTANIANAKDVCATGSPWRGISLSSRAFKNECGSVSEIVFHELLHVVGIMPEKESHRRSNPKDVVYACTAAVFGKSSQDQTSVCEKATF